MRFKDEGDLGGSSTLANFVVIKILFLSLAKFMIYRTSATFESHSLDRYLCIVIIFPVYEARVILAKFIERTFRYVV